MNQKVLFASSNIGRGFWTSICVMCCSIIGKESKAYKRKQDLVLKRANAGLAAQLDKLNEDYHISDYRVTWSGPLSVTVSALAELKESPKGKKEEKDNVCPKCGTINEKGSLFCSECGEKLK